MWHAVICDHNIWVVFITSAGKTKTFSTQPTFPTIPEIILQYSHKTKKNQ